MSVAVKQDPENPVLPEVLASSIKKLADSVTMWHRAGLKQRVLVLLLHDLSRVGISDITCVLNSIAALEREYCIQKPVPAKK